MVAKVQKIFKIEKIVVYLLNIFTLAYLNKTIDMNDLG